MIAAIVSAVLCLFAIAFVVALLFVLLSIETGYTTKPPAKPSIWNMPITKAVPTLWSLITNRHKQGG